jgi:hypothetical protein
MGDVQLPPSAPSNENRVVVRSDRHPSRKASTKNISCSLYFLSATCTRMALGTKCCRGLEPPHPIVGAANGAAHLWSCNLCCSSVELQTAPPVSVDDRMKHQRPWLRSSGDHRMEHRRIGFVASPPLLCSTEDILMQLCRRSLAAPVRHRISLAAIAAPEVRDRVLWGRSTSQRSGG